MRAPGGQPGRFPALQYRDFRLYWGAQFVSTAGTQMRMAGIAWQVYLLTHSALALGLLGLVRVVPLVVLSLGGGVIADAVNRRVLLLVTQTAFLVISALLAIVTFEHVVTLWLIYLLVGIAAAALAFDNPARQAMIPVLVPPERLTNALSLNSTVFQIATVLGPSLAGIVIAAASVGAVYAIDALSFLAIILALLLIHPPPVAGDTPRITLEAALEGLSFVRNSPLLLSTMLLDGVATFFGSATALLPIFARDILHVGSAGYGILYAAPSVGAIITGVALSTRVRGVYHQGPVILVAVALYGVFTFLFGLSHIFLLSLAALAGVGASDTVSMILRQTLRQTITPDALRGRMTSVTMVFFMGGPQLGELEAGVVARGFGAPFSVMSGGIAAIGFVGLIAALAPTLRRYRDPGFASTSTRDLPTDRATSSAIPLRERRSHGD